MILEIEIQGAMKIREKFPDTLLVFVCPPSMEELKNRLVGRGTETLDVINGRLRRAVEESRGMDKYDYLLINDDLENVLIHFIETIGVSACVHPGIMILYPGSERSGSFFINTN